MIEALKSDELINKVGGKFKLTALVQRRMEEILQGSRPLIEDTEGKTLIEIVIEEIRQDKIQPEGVPEAKGIVPGPESTINPFF